MTLWNPGTIENVTFRNAKRQLGMDGITLAQLREILKAIHADHCRTERAEWESDEDYADYVENHAGNIPWDEMPIRDWKTAEEIGGDSNFDLISQAAWNETPVIVSFEGEEWKVSPRVGGTALIAVTDENRIARIGSWSGCKISEKDCADLIRASGFVNPDPYIGLIEVQYHSKGWRAGYGVRRSGAADCWYN